MDLAFNIVPAVVGLVKTCYKLYGNHSLKKANRQIAKQLGEKLREIEVSLRTMAESERSQEHDVIIRGICTDVGEIEAYITDTMDEINKRRGLAALLDAPGIAQSLQNALQLALVCRTRLENLQIAVAQHVRHESYLQQWHALFIHFQEIAARISVDDSVSNAFNLLNTAAVNLLPSKDSASAGEAPAPSDIDASEAMNVRALFEVPEAVQKLVISAARHRQKRKDVQALVDKLIKLWDGWHIQDEHLAFELRRGRRPIALGSGAFGTVFAGKLYSDGSSDDSKGSSVAIKQVDLSANTRTMLAEVIREALLQMTLRHECILHCVNLPTWAGTSAEIGAATGDDDAPEEALIVTERMSCNLAEALQCRDTVKKICSFEDKLRVVTDVARALEFLHSHNVVHRDVKPENVLLKFEDSGLVGFAKLSDFGSSRRAHMEHSKRLLTTAGMVSGTPLFMPPEALAKLEECRSRPSWDVWSFGVLLCFVFAHEHKPEFSFGEMQRLADDGAWARQMAEWVTHITEEEVRATARRCLDEEPKRRGRAAELFCPVASESQVPERLRMRKEGIMYLKGDQVAKDPARAVELLLQAMALGDSGAIPILAMCYQGWFGVEKDSKRAFLLFSQSVENGSVTAIYSLAMCYVNAEGTDEDSDAALRLFKKGASLDNLNCINRLGWAHANGYGTVKKVAEAVCWYEKAIYKGHTGSMVDLGLLLQGVTVVRDEQRAFKLLEQAMELGEPRTLFPLAGCYRTGKGVVKDLKFTVKYYSMAIEKDVPEAMVSLAIFLLRGVAGAIEQDQPRGFSLLKRAMELGHDGAQYLLADCYLFGKGIAEDKQAAVIYLQPLARKSHHRAQLRLGLCYLNGTGAPKDTASGLDLIERSAAENNQAMYTMAELFRTGAFMQSNAEKSLEWYKKASVAGYTLADWFVIDGNLEKPGTQGEKGLAIVERAATNGSKDALFILSRCYKSGVDVDVDLKQHLKLLIKAGNAHHAEANFMLSEYYGQGNFLKKNGKESWQRLNLSAHFGHVPAIHRLGVHYLREKDDRAAYYFREAADKGHVESTHAVAICHRDGNGVEKDAVRYVEWLERASQLGHIAATNEMGECLYLGIGIEKDPIWAFQLFEKAADQGDKRAIKNRAICYRDGCGVRKDNDKALKTADAIISKFHSA